MKISEALEAVSARYVPGVIRYYSKLNPDPWQQAHDELEKFVGVFNERTVSPACERFVSRCSELISRFENEGTVSKSLAPSDAFAMTTRAAMDAHISRKHKQCAKCESKTNLKIMPIEHDGIDVQIVCSACLPKMQRSL